MQASGKLFPWMLLAAISAPGCATTSARGAAAPELASAERAFPAGAGVFARECAPCHGKRGEGVGSVPAVMGAGALPEVNHDGVRFDSALDLFSYTQREMPLPKSRAGSLSDAEYWAVTSFTLRAHGVAVPEEGVTPGNAAGIRLR